MINTVKFKGAQFGALILKELKVLINKDVVKRIQIPLSPRAEKQIELKPLKSYDFKGFFIFTTFKTFINS